MKRLVIVFATLVFTTELGTTASLHYADPARVGYICFNSPADMRHFHHDNELHAKYSLRMEGHYGERCWYPKDGTREMLSARAVPKRVYPPLLPTTNTVPATAKPKPIMASASPKEIALAPLEPTPVTTIRPAHIQKLRILLGINPVLWPDWTKEWASFANRNYDEDYNGRVRALVITRVTQTMER